MDTYCERPCKQQRVVFKNFSPFNTRNSKVLALIVSLVFLFSLPAGCNSQCTEDRGCFPPSGNLAIGRTLNTDSTCTAGSEYCPFLQNICFTCSPNTTNSPVNLNDNDRSTVWVSQIGPSAIPTAIQLDFETEFLFDNMLIVFASIRPQTMVLEYSKDYGLNWGVYRYYSTRCTVMFGLDDTFIDGLVFETLDPICTSSETLLFPFEGGEVTFSTAQHLSFNISEIEATRYRTVTNIRIQLLEYFEENELRGNSSIYFSISEWYVNGTCMCNGHSGICSRQTNDQVVPDKIYGGCDCEHNTAGEQCERCITGFNSVPWRPGTNTSANVCQECVCNEHARDCQFIPDLSSAVCINCTDNTEGDKCQLCEPGYFQDMALLLNDPNICRACGCSKEGAVNESCDPQGMCTCKTNVDPMSVKCTECLEGYWNLTLDNLYGCEVCDCVTDGTLQANNLPLCDKETGVCVCTERAEGQQCDRCKPGFYDLSSGCLSCNCNLGGSNSSVCDQNSPEAQCPCKPNIESILCSSPVAGYYFKQLDNLVIEAEESAFEDETSTFFPLEGATAPFTGRGFIRPSPLSNIRFGVFVPQSTQYEIIIRYQTMAPVEGLTLTLYSSNGVTLDLDCDETLTPTNVTRFGVATLQPDSLFYTAFTVCLDNSVEYQLLLEYTSFSPVEWLLDSIALLPDFGETSTYYQSRSSKDQVSIIEPCLPRAVTTEQSLVCEQPSFSLSTEFFGQVFECDCDPIGTENILQPCNAFGGYCAPCISGVTGARCDQCMNGWFNFSTTGCLECNCDNEGSTGPVCDLLSGECNCQPGTTTRTCSECQPGYYNLTSNGCSPCRCSEFSLSQQCDNAGQCQCPDGVTGLKCDICLPEFYNISNEGCMQCQCDPLGSESEQCDVISGQCVCTGNSVGLNCNECPEGSFLTSGRIVERCIECICTGKTNECVADEANFVLGSIQTDFTILCATEPAQCASGWRLLTENGQPAAPFGPSDSSGLGYILLLNDQPMLFAPDHFIGDRLGSYGQTFEMFVIVDNGLEGQPGTLRLNSTIVRMVSSLTGDVIEAIFPPPVIEQNAFGSNRILHYSILLLENNWHVGDSNGRTPSQLEFQSILANIGQLSVSADFTEDLIEFIHIVNITLMSTFSNTELTERDVVVVTTSYPVGDCLCPDGFTGISCQDCSQGHYRLSGDIRDICLRCECNNQTQKCNSTSGVCHNCTGNTVGDNCEHCISGYYGDPTRGIPCIECSCPLIENSFSGTCFLDYDDQQTCDSCELGYTGRNCEICMDGYFGNPLIGFCNDCQCNGNVDPALGPVCDTITGRCMNCQNNTTGFNCGICRPGFFGDPTLPGQVCQPCPCNTRGTVGDCDPLFGKCFCEPNVIGPLCDECANGYWGLSQGLGCIPCDCCINGSINTTCNKDTGVCVCLPNVGSVEDDKCCTCTPGSFNFSSTTGCAECGCSSLAISNECDLVSGRCQCAVGAIGLKCNDCAFGFTGQVPDCERCHECYLQWYEIIANLASRIAELEVQVNSQVTTYYNGHTLNTIQSELNRWINLLEDANTTLNTITLSENGVRILEESLGQVNDSLNQYVLNILDIEMALNMSEMHLDRAFEFDGSVNMSDVTMLQDLIYAYNSSIGVMVADVNASFEVLSIVQGEIYIVWEELDNLELFVQQLVANVSAQEQEAAAVGAEFRRIKTMYSLFRTNLTYLDIRANQLIDELSMLSRGVMNMSVQTQSNNNSVSSLKTDIQEKLAQANISLELAKQLNFTVTTAYSAVREANERIQQLLVQAQHGASEANHTLSNIINSLQTLSEIWSILTLSKNTSQDALSLSGFSTEHARQLVLAINTTILPETFVTEIIQNASDSQEIATGALRIAQNALYAISTALTLVGNVYEEINCSKQHQEQLAHNLSLLLDSIMQKETMSEQVIILSDNLTVLIQEVYQTRDSTEQYLTNVQQLISNGTSNIKNEAEDLQIITNITAMHQQDVNHATEIHSFNLQGQIAAAYFNASDTLSKVQSLHQQAQNETMAARNVQLESIRGLLQIYLNESAELNNLNTRATSLQQQLDSLTLSLQNAANRLTNCYKTP